MTIKIQLVIQINEKISIAEQKKDKLSYINDFYILKCYSKPNDKFNLDDKYYFYYNKTKAKFSFDKNDILEDDKQISLIFKLEVNIHRNRKIAGYTNAAIDKGGILNKKIKNVLIRPKDGFKKF